MTIYCFIQLDSKEGYCTGAGPLLPNGSGNGEGQGQAAVHCAAISRSRMLDVVFKISIEAEKQHE